MTIPAERPFGGAAEKYRARGLLGTLPLPNGQKASPPAGFTGGGRPHPTDDQVAEWVGQRPRGNIALRLAEVPREFLNNRDDRTPIYAGNNVDGWELVGIDVDNYSKGDCEKRGAEQLCELELQLGQLPATVLSGARFGTGSSIAVYLVPQGYRFAGKAADSIEVIQKRHRYMVVHPSTNPDAPGVGGQPAMYEWGWGAPSKFADAGPDSLERFEDGMPSVDRIAVLPEAWFTHLTHGGMGESDDPISGLTDGELWEWLEARPGYGDEMCSVMRAAADELVAGIETSSSSHDVLTQAHWRLLKLAAEGHAGVEAALDEVTAAGWPAAAGKRDVETLSAEMGRSIAGALDKIQPAYRDYVPDDSCAVDPRKFDCDGWAARLDTQGDTGVTVDDLTAFWAARPELTRLQQFARSRLTGPWSTLGAVLARVIATMPPNVVLPPTVGDHASFNLFVALVAPSGYGKGASEAVAEAFLDMATNVWEATPGSGEGLLKQYAYKRRPGKGQPPEQVNVRNAVLFTIAEVDTLNALAGRNGATLIPELRKAWMGERLGFGYADAEKAVAIMAHRYRMTMVVGVQPGRGASLLSDADGGTPQRFLWLPTTDPDATDDLVEAPEPFSLPAWPTARPAENSSADGIRDDEFAEPAEHDEPAEDDQGEQPRLKFAVVRDGFRLDEPAQRSAFHVLDLPPSVVEEIRAEHLAKRRGDMSINPLDSHAMLARLKVAAGLMWLNGRTDEINEDDWKLAGTVLAVSNSTRATVLAAMRSNETKVAEARGRSDAVREVVKEDVLRDRKIARLAEGIREKLRVENDQPFNRLSKRFRSQDRSVVRPALDLLVSVGDVALRAIEHHGNAGEVAHLREGR